MSLVGAELNDLQNKEQKQIDVTPNRILQC